MPDAELAWRVEATCFNAFPSLKQAILAGWLTTEIGRQPWVVYGVMRTSEAVSDHSPLEISATLTIRSGLARCMTWYHREASWGLDFNLVQ